MGRLFEWPPSWATLFLIPALLVGFTVHELAHALVAFLLGDTSQVERNRLSFNPLRHVSWLGMVVFLLVGVGWAKPVWVDHARLRAQNRAFAMFLVSVAGAAANLVTAVVTLVGMTVTVSVVWLWTATPPFEVLQYLIAQDLAPDPHGFAVAMTYYMVMVNLLLAIFNLIPLPPLDGFQALISLYSLIRTSLRSGPRPTVSPPSAEQDAAKAHAGQSPAEIHFGIGLEYQRSGQLEPAIARYRQAIAHDEGYALAYHNLGLAYWAQGRLTLAESAFRAAARTSDDLAVRAQSEARLHELAHGPSKPGVQSQPLPPPLETAAAQVLVSSLDPGVARQVWLRLSVGGALAFVMAVAVWLFFTAVTLEAML